MPEAQYWAGEASRSTRHAAMNATFVGSGIRALLAGLVLAPFVPRLGRWVVLPLVCAYALGQVLVGFFPAGTGAVRAPAHGIGAFLAIGGGCLLLVAVAVSFVRRNPVLTLVTGAIGAIGIASAWVGMSGAGHTGFGLYERLAVDTVMVWQVVVGVLVLATARPPSSVGVRQRD